MLSVSKVVFGSLATGRVAISVHMSFNYDGELVSRRTLGDPRVNSTFRWVDNGEITRDIQTSVFSSAYHLYWFFGRIRSRCS